MNTQSDKPSGVPPEVIAYLSRPHLGIPSGARERVATLLISHGALPTTTGGYVLPSGQPAIEWLNDRRNGGGEDAAAFVVQSAPKSDATSRLYNVNAGQPALPSVTVEQRRRLTASQKLAIANGDTTPGLRGTFDLSPVEEAKPDV